MLDLIFFIPLLTVIALAATCRLVFRRKSSGPLGWLGLTSVTIALLIAAVLPLGYGVWLPDIFGPQHTLCSATSSSGHRVSIIQYWNHEDFYTTEARVTDPDGVTVITLLDGDDGKAWTATLHLDPSQTSATFTIPDGLTGRITW